MTGKKTINLHPKRIIVRCPNWVGDLVMCVPALRSIRNQFSKAHISIILKPSLTPVVKHLPFFDEIIEYEPKGMDKGLKHYVSFIRQIRQKQYDLGILMPHSFSSALIFFLSAIPARIGYDRNARGWMLTHKLQPVREHGKIIPENMVAHYLTISSYLGCNNLDPCLELITDKSAEKWADLFFSQQGITEDDLLTVIIPGASYGSSKCWTDSSFAEVADALILKYGARVLIIPGPGELDIAQRIIQSMKQSPVTLDYKILPLDHLMAVIKRCSILITNDTGPRHFGVAFNKPVVVLIGPTDSRYTDYCHDKTVIVKEDVDCAPCHLKQCPTDHRCMTRITPEKVIEAAGKLIIKYGLMPFPS